MTVQNVSEFPATAPEQIDHFAKLLRKSAQRRAIFLEVCRGQSKSAKTAAEIAGRVSLTAKRVLEVASPLAAHQLFEKTKRDGQVAYKKYPNINAVKHKIISLATNKDRLGAHVTVRNPRRTSTTIEVKIKHSAREVFVDVRPVTLDTIDNFSRVRSRRMRSVPKNMAPPRLPEKVFKYGVAKILGESGKFTDWGGEKNDLYATDVRIKPRRYTAAIGFKGPATTGTLTPGKMGHNGDQIQRLFESDAQVFLVQYEGQIAESVLTQMKALAVNKSVEDRRTVFYGAISKQDSYRLRIRYPRDFSDAAAGL